MPRLFFSHLLTQVYLHCEADAIILCGDLNTRIGYTQENKYCFDKSISSKYSMTSFHPNSYGIFRVQETTFVNAMVTSSIRHEWCSQILNDDAIFKISVTWEHLLNKLFV